MKTYYKIIISMALTAILSAVEAQNPYGGLEQSVDTICFRGLKITPEIEDELAAIPQLSISSASEATVLPNGIDNSKRDWFRSIFFQTDDCCGQAAGVGYAFTYEVNRMRLQTANVETRQYLTHFTYNFLNESDTTRGSWPHNGWDVIKQMGVPSVADYGGMCKNLLIPDRINVWETGYDHYYHALSNKVVLSYEKETVLYNTQIDRIKHWLNDHGNGDPYGGLAVFCANVFWGSGLNPNTHFVSTNPNVSFTYLPLWNPGSCLGNEGGDVRDMVTLADSLSDIGRFGEAKLVYKQIVSLYPSTVEAQVALKTLFNLECVSGLDFDGLKTYYLNDTVIARNNNLNKLASSLSNRCNEVMRRYEDAIMWYEGVLLDTLSTFNDSIFAAIDLGNLYLRMDAMGEKGVAGKLTQYIPVSREAYDKQVLYALSLLRDSEQTTTDDYPTDYWMDVVTEQPEGYEMDAQGNVTISTAEGLAWLAAVVNGRNGQEANDFEGKEVKLVSDIDMGVHLWEAIGNSYFDDSISYDYVQRYFKGSFDGGKYEISNLVFGERGYYKRPDQFSGYDKCQGLFGNLFDAEVKKLKLNDFVCMNQDDMIMHFGSIACYSEQSVIDRCVSKGSVYEFYNGQYANNSEIYVGGLVYSNLNSKVSNCVFVADSCVSYEMGGIVHSNITTMEDHRAEISNCYFYGEMYDDPLIFKDRTMHTSAGIVQYNSTDPEIEQGSIVRNCYYYPTEPRGDMVGYRAAVAWWHRGNSVIENCYYLAEHEVPFYTGVVSRPDEWATVDNTSAFYYANDGCVLEDPVEIGGETVDDLKEALNRWIAVQQNSEDYENWCEDVWMEQGGAPLLCNVYEATEEITEKPSYVVPNPVENTLSIISDEVVTTAIYDATGKMIVKTTDKHIDMAMYKPGIYIVSITFNDGRNHVQKIVKK